MPCTAPVWVKQKEFAPIQRVAGVEPALDLAAVLIVENADYTTLHINARSPCAHQAKGAHVLVVAEHIVLAEPESLCSHLGEPHKERIPGPWMSPAIG